MPMLTVIDTITDQIGRGFASSKSPNVVEIALTALAPKLLLTLKPVPMQSLTIFAGTYNIVERPQASMNIGEDWPDTKLTLILLDTHAMPKYALVLIASPAELDIAPTVTSLRNHLHQGRELTMQMPFLYIPYYLEGKPSMLMRELAPS